MTYGTTAAPPAASPSTQTSAEFGEQITLAGYDLPAGPWQPGDVVTLTLFWLAAEPIGKDYNIFVHLLDDSGQLAAQTDSSPAGGSLPTSGWQAGEAIVDRHGILLPDTLPAGEHELRVGLYAPATGDRLPVRDAAGQPLGDSLLLDTIVVSPP